MMLDAAALGEDTVWYGAVIDEAHLFGLLARFRILDLLVTQMRQAPSPVDGGRPPPTDQP
ncbi:hypothetical protein ACIF8T_38070 [Streptomyces sp. NPDC085946]|uniref:hypothetical protein n=1 Tax=Streptomyces sp. NPDC085946 TaxID=3365744 RepID=UPI0037D9088B